MYLQISLWITLYTLSLVKMKFVLYVNNIDNNNHSNCFCAFFDNLKFDICCCLQFEAKNFFHLLCEISKYGCCDKQVAQM